MFLINIFENNKDNIEINLSAHQSYGYATASMTPLVRTQRVRQKKQIGIKMDQQGAKREPHGNQIGAKWEPKDRKWCPCHYFGVPCGGGTASLLYRTSKVRKRVTKGWPPSGTKER